MEPNKVEEICDRYKEGEHGTSIAQDFDIHWSHLYKLLRRNGVETRDRRADVDDSAFTNLDPDTSYWIGFIGADGHIKYTDDETRQSSVAIQLSDVDLGHLKKLKCFLDYKGNIHTDGKPRDKATLELTSDRIVNDLIKWNVTPRKSKTFKPHTELRENRHFWRGMVDGDGSITFTKTQNTPRLSLCGSKYTARYFQSFCKHITNPYASVRDHGESFIYTIAGRYLIDVVKVLYRNCDTYLSRKQERSEQIISDYGDHDD